MHSSLPTFLTDPSFYIALAALALSLWVYFAHDKRIKRQESLINQFEIEKLTQEKELLKKANLEVHIKDGPPGRQDLVIINTGKNIAENIRISIEENDGMEGFIIAESLSPFELHQNQSRTISLFSTNESPDCISATLKWNDDHKVDNQVTYKFSI